MERPSFTRTITGTIGAVGGLAVLAVAAAVPAAAQQVAAARPRNEQVALVNETGAQPEHKSHLNGTAQVHLARRPVRRLLDGRGTGAVGHQWHRRRLPA